MMEKHILVLISDSVGSMECILAARGRHFVLLLWVERTCYQTALSSELNFFFSVFDMGGDGLDVVVKYATCLYVLLFTYIYEKRDSPA